MSLRSFCIAVACILTPVLAQALTLPALPAGMCALDTHVPEQSAIIDYLKKAGKDNNEFVIGFARCDELILIMQKKDGSLRHYGTVLRQSLGQEIPLDRKTYVAAANAMLSANNGKIMETALTSARESTADATADGDIANPKSIQGTAPGVLFKNDDMVIIGMQQTNNLGGRQVRVASTAAMTLVDGSPVSVNLYAPLSDMNVFKQAGATLQPFVTQLIAANK